MHEPEPGIVRPELDDCVATCRDNQHVTHGRVDQVQGRGSSVAPRRPRAQLAVADDVLIIAQVDPGCAVEGRVAHGQDREVVAVHVDRVMRKERRNGRIVVDEHQSDGFVVRQTENVRASTSASIACCLVTRHDALLSTDTYQMVMLMCDWSWTLPSEQT